MGCDIHGFIEVRKYDWSEDWDMCMDIQSLLHRNYSMFACLFGVRDYSHFLPAAPQRGLPENASEEVKASCAQWGEDGHSHSYITIQEIKNINWDEYSTQLSDHIDCYKQGESTPFTSFVSSSVLTPLDYRLLSAGMTVVKINQSSETISYKKNFAKKSEAISDDWKLLLSIMEQLEAHYRKDAQQYANEENVVESVPTVIPYVDTSRVRLVVWFDN